MNEKLTNSHKNYQYTDNKNSSIKKIIKRAWCLANYQLTDQHYGKKDVNTVLKQKV